MEFAPYTLGVILGLLRNRAGGWKVAANFRGRRRFHVFEKECKFFGHHARAHTSGRRRLCRPAKLQRKRS